MDKTTQEKLGEVINKYFCDCIDCSNISNFDALKISETSLSSIKYMSLIVELEVAFDIQIDNPLIYSMELTVREFVEYINRLVSKGNAND